VAACAEVSVSADGELKVHRIVAATDCGYAVNPQQIEAQVEGSFVYGLSAALFGECTVKDGRIEQDNFHTYPVNDASHAQGGDRAGPVGRLLGRCGRAHHCGGGAGGAERHLRGHGQTHPRPAASRTRTSSVAEMVVLQRGSRLSITPVAEAHWAWIVGRLSRA
jgi:hypothetical protein